MKRENFKTTLQMVLSDEKKKEVWKRLPTERHSVCLLWFLWRYAHMTIGIWYFQIFGSSSKEREISHHDSSLYRPGSELVVCLWWIRPIVQWSPPPCVCVCLWKCVFVNACTHVWLGVIFLCVTLAMSHNIYICGSHRNSSAALTDQ